MAKSYEERKEQVKDILNEQSRRGRDIAPLPEVANPKRRKKCEKNLRAFCDTYFKAVFNIPWSEDHLAALDTIQRSTLQGGLFCLCMPRGSGKTTLTIAAAIWGLLYGHQSFVVLIGASETAAYELLDTIKIELEVNELLNADFPEVCFPIKNLEGRANNCPGQLLDGERTRITWTQDELVLPTVPGSKASGSVVRVAGITGRIRGMQSKRASDGATIRPTWVAIDDPQTDESAHSPTQVAKRLATVSGAVLGLAGPRKKIAGIMPVTVVAKDDLADRVLDRNKFPDWQGIKTKLLPALPTDDKLWEQYAEIRANGLRAGRGLIDATAFYKANQAALDAGAKASWPERYNPDELSAIQNAMNLKLQDEVAFSAEYQNEPLDQTKATPLLLLPDQVIAKRIDIERSVVPKQSTQLTAFIDVQGTVLYYCVVAFEENFSGHVVDYGAYPDQGKSYFLLRDVANTMQAAKPGAGFEAYLFAGIDKLTTELLDRNYIKQDGNDMSISRLMIDANWGDSTTVIKQWHRQYSRRSLVLPSHGVGITADKKPMNEYSTKDGERSGWNWRVETEGHIRFDTNSWKTFVAQRLISSFGEAGCLTIFKASEIQHKLFAEHITGEYPTQTEGLGRTVNVWKAKPNRENHLLDCLVGCYVSASERGTKFLGHQPATPDKPKLRKRTRYNVSY